MQQMVMPYNAKMSSPPLIDYVQKQRPLHHNNTLSIISLPPPTVRPPFPLPFPPSAVRLSIRPSIIPHVRSFYFCPSIRSSICLSIISPSLCFPPFLHMLLAPVSPSILHYIHLSVCPSIP